MNPRELASVKDLSAIIGGFAIATGIALVFLAVAGTVL